MLFRSKEKYPELIKLILGSESMNDEERQYWINILPVMTPEQQENLNQILTNEKDQLAAIDEKYKKEMGQLEKEEGRAIEDIEKERREKQKSRRGQEKGAEAEEKEKEKEILKAISELDE